MGAVLLTGSLALSGCGGSGPPVPDNTGPTSDTPIPAPTTTSTTTSMVVNDAAWLAQADQACSIAIDEYGSWKAGAGSGGSPDALALGAASAATRAADAISGMPEPTNREALSLREAVVAWAAAYRDMSTAMERGSYSEVTSAGDAVEEAADVIRGLASSAPSCSDMTDKV